MGEPERGCRGPARVLAMLLCAWSAGCDGGGPSGPEPLTLVAVTFNTGTTEGIVDESDPDPAYTLEHAAISDAWYGDGLAWLPAVEAARSFFAELQPDVVAFQEIFHAAECPQIPTDAHQDFYCQTWQPGDPTVASYVLGPDYQVACHPEHPDKCAAVHRRLGTFRGCEADYCLEGLAGFRVEGCGRGARVGRGVIDLVAGGSLTLVNYHGSSGVTTEEQTCRVAQIDQVFVDLGDGQPGAKGVRNLILGDLNTDPGRMDSYDLSAQRWWDFVGPDRPFHFITPVGFDAPASYLIFNIDHQIADGAEGDCWTAGLTEGHPAVIDANYFDHKPVVCALTWAPLAD